MLSTDCQSDVTVMSNEWPCRARHQMEKGVCHFNVQLGLAEHSKAGIYITELSLHKSALRSLPLCRPRVACGKLRNSCGHVV